MPSFKSSSNIGTSFNLPYYHVISDNKDFTIRPRFYADEKLLIQSEYRQVNSNSNHSIDYSFFNGKNESNKSHLFLNTYKELNFSYFEDSQLDIKLEQVTNDSYLKVYDIKSPIINSSSSLESSIEIGASKENLSLDLDFQIFESLAVDKKSDKYEYILPNYNLIKEFREIDQFSGIFSLNSTGSLTNYNTNVSEKIMINDFYFKSHPKFNGNGIESKYNFLVKNTNTDSENSLKYEKNSNHDVATLVEYNSSYPLKKITQDHSNIIKPKISLRYSPNNSKNLRNEERRVDTNNIFSLTKTQP